MGPVHRGGFGYETTGSPDLCAFGYAEVDSDTEGPALMLLGSSGTMIVTVNEKVVFESTNRRGPGVRARHRPGAVPTGTGAGTGSWS